MLLLQDVARALALTDELATALRKRGTSSAETAWLETQLVSVDEAWRGSGDANASRSAVITCQLAQPASKNTPMISTHRSVDESSSGGWAQVLKPSASLTPPYSPA